MPNLQTRIKLKYDTLENWQLVADTFTPLAGEVCICEVPTGDSLEQTTPPATLCKVGDGVNTWANLPWMSALAADVYPWAKLPTPPAETDISVDDNGAGAFSDLTANGHNITVTRTSLAGTVSAATGNVAINVTQDAYGKITSIGSTKITNAYIADDAGIVGTKLAASTVEKDRLSISVQNSLNNADSAVQSVVSGSVNGNISVDGESVAIPGWGTIATAQQCASAAYTLATSANELATTANNTASTALQPSDITTGTANGTISVDGDDVLVKGLGSAAYTASTAYEAAGAVSNHNTSGTAHADIRSLITGLTEKVNGRTTAYVYQNKSDSDYTAAIAKAGSFIIGDTIYFLDPDIPDEWVTAVNASSPFYTFQEIETESPSFDGYVTGTSLTAEKIVLGNAGSAVKASVYGIVTTLTDSDNSNVATSKAVADYIGTLGHITKTTADDIYAPMATKTTVDSIMSGATVVPTANNYAAGGNIATALAGKQAAHNALTNLSSIMVNSDEGTGFIKKTGANTYDIDPNTYLTSASLSGYATQSWVTDQGYQNATQVNNLINTAVSSGSIKEALDDKQPIDADLTAIAGLTGTSGLLRKTAANTWSLDTNTYVTTANFSTNLAGKYDTINDTGSGVITDILENTTQANQIDVSRTSFAHTASATSGNYVTGVTQAANGYTTITQAVLPTPGNGALQDGTGNVIFTANQSTNTQILVIDCGTASTVVYDVP